MATVPPGARPVPTPPKRERDRAKEDALLQKASSVRAVWKTLASAFSPPPEEPPRNKCHWDFVLQEGAWLAHDVMQERMWKHAAARALSHAAVAFDRRKLKPTKTHVCASVERPASEFGRVKQDGKPLFPSAQAQSKAGSHEAPQSSAQGTPVPLSPLFFTCPHGLADALTEALEEEDVMRLACHVEAQLVYQATVTAARRAQPMPAYAEEDLQQLGKRKRKAPKPATPGVPMTEDEYEGGASPVASARAPQRRTGGGMGAGPARGSMADMGEEGGVMPGGRERRKRKMRDFGDDEYELPGKAAAAARAERGGGMRGAAASGGMGGAGGGTDRRVSHKAGAGINARQSRGAGMQPLVGGRAGMAGPGMAGGLAGAPAAGMFGRPGPWSSQDDHLLVAIVTEFSQNWHLVADVLRSASSMSGVFRRFDVCKQRYSLLLRMSLGDGEQPLQEVPPHLQQQPIMSKAAAKEVVAASLPVHEAVLQAHQSVVTSLTARIRQRRVEERQQTRSSHQVHIAEHPTHLKIQQAVLESWGNRFGTPLEIGSVVDPAAQQAVLLQQQQQQQQQQAASAAAALQQQQQQQQQAAAKAAAAAAAATSQAQAQQQAAASTPSGTPFAAPSTNPAPAASLALPPTSPADLATMAAQAQQAAAAAAAASNMGGGRQGQPGQTAPIPPMPAAAAAAAAAAAMGGMQGPGLPARPSATPEPPAGAAAALQQQQQHHHQPKAPRDSTHAQQPPADTDMMGAAQQMPLAQLQAQLQAAQAAAAANPTPQLQMQAQMAAAMLAAAHTLRGTPQQPSQVGLSPTGATTASPMPNMAAANNALPPHALTPPGNAADMAAMAAAVSGAFPAGPMAAGTPQQQQQQAALAQAQLAALQAQFAPMPPGGKQGGAAMAGMSPMPQLNFKQLQQQQQGGAQGSGSRGGGGGQQPQQHQQHQQHQQGSLAGMMGPSPVPSSGPLTPQQLQMQLQQVQQQAALWGGGLPGMGNIQLPPQMAAAAAAAVQQQQQQQPGQQLPVGLQPFNLPQFGSQPRPPL